LEDQEAVMGITSAELLGLLRELPLLPATWREQLGNATALPEDADTLAQTLVRDNWLTSYQASQLLAGAGHDLVLDQHVLLEPLGSGGMGSVFKARHLRLDRLEALKILRPEYLATPEAVQRFLREARAVARLNHPHIVRIYDAGEQAGRHFLAMEYLEGSDLAARVAGDGPLPPPQVCVLLYQAALGLQHAFEKGLVHRDIKPSNLFLASASVSGEVEEGVLKVLDLGLARLQPLSAAPAPTSLTPSGTVLGTPDYIAPEQARNHRAADIRSDLYSLGCTAYHLLAGQPPFLGGGMMEKLLRHQTEPPPPLERACPEVPPRLAAVVRQLMEKDPARRYQTPAALAAALKPLLRTARLKTRRRPAPPPAPPADTLAAPSFHAPLVLPPLPRSTCRRGLSARLVWSVVGAIGALVLLALLVLWRLRR
jgi:serine/threonine-protein kinase